MELIAEEVAQADAEGPHGENGQAHGEFHVAGGTEAVGQSEGQGPHGAHADGVVDQQMYGQVKGITAQVVGGHNGTAEQDNDGAEGNDGAVGNGQQPQGVFLGLLFLLRTDAAAHNDDHGGADGAAGNILQGGDGQCGGVGGDLCRTEGGDEALGQHTAQLEHAVFQSVGDTDAADAADQVAVGPDLPQGCHVEGVLPVVQQAQQQDAAAGTGQQRTQCRTGHAHVQSVDEEGVGCDVDNVHHHRGQHGDTGITHGGEAGFAAGEKAKEGIGQSGVEEIGAGAGHDVGLNAAEQEPQQRFVQRHSGQGHYCCHGYHRQQQLTHCLVGPLLTAVAQQLSNDHAAAGGKGGEEVHQQLVDGVHQPHAGNGGFTGGGDHDGVLHADGHRQHLADHQRDHDIHKAAAGKDHDVISFGGGLSAHDPS